MHTPEPWMVDPDDRPGYEWNNHIVSATDPNQTICFMTHDMEKMRMGLENCRLLAARHRKEDWALLILGFCAEAGVVGSVTR